MSSHYEMAEGVIHNITGKFGKDEVEEGIEIGVAS